MKEKGITPRRASSTTRPEDVCPTCNEYVVLRAGNGDKDDKACSDPECKSAHGYDLPTVTPPG